MKITETDIDYVARLAHLEVSAEEKPELARQLSRILDYVEQLKGVNVEGVVPTTHALPESSHERRDGREDRVILRQGSAEPGRASRTIKVPRVITER